MNQNLTNNSTTKEKNENNFVGIDVAKDELVLYILPNNEQLTVPNSAEGIKQLVKRFKKMGVSNLFGTIPCILPWRNIRVTSWTWKNSFQQKMPAKIICFAYVGRTDLFVHCGKPKATGRRHVDVLCAVNANTKRRLLRVRFFIIPASP